MGEELTALGHAVAGSGGAVLALIITYPLDIVKTRMQVQTKDSAYSTNYKSIPDALGKIVENEGVIGLYSGLRSGLVGVAATNFCYFYWYNAIRGAYVRLLRNRSRQSVGEKNAALAVVEIGTAMELALGALAGGLAQLMTIPVSVVTTRQQTSAIKPVDDIDTLSARKRRSMMATMRQIVRDDGIAGLWRGLRPALVLTVNPAITYGLFERMKSLLLARKRSADPTAILTAIDTFILGLLSKTVATIVTYPYIMAKVRLQWRPQDYDSNERVRYQGALDVLYRVLNSEGWRGWYKGMQAQIVKAVLTQALLFVIKDKLVLYTILASKRIPGANRIFLK